MGAMTPLERFAAQLRQREPEMERVALAIAGIEYPDLDEEACVRALDLLAEFVGQGFAVQPPGEDRAAYFLHAVHNELGFVGNHDDYYDPDNSYLNQVLLRRTGLPILLSVVCIALGRRLQATIDGIGFPGHFMVQYRDARGAWLLDVFHGKMLPVVEADDYLSQMFNRAVRLPLDVFEPASVEDIAARILNNLRGVYLQRGNAERAVQVLDYLVALQPENAQFWQERALLHRQLGEFEMAARDLRRYFYLSGHLAELIQSVNRAEDVSSSLSHQDRHLLRVLEEIEQTRTLLN